MSEADLQFLQRCRCDPRWAATEIHNLHRMLKLLVQQVDMPLNEERTLKTFRGGTLMERARAMVLDLEPPKNP